MSHTHEPNSLETKWEFIFSAVSFSGMALIFPAILAFQSPFQQNEIENTLKESDERYHNIFQTISDPLLILDADSYMFEDVNDAALNEYGYTREDFLSLTPWEISAEPDSTEKAIKANLAGTLKKIPLRYHKKKDGTVFPAEITTGTFNVKNKRKVFAIVRNISDQKIAEEKLRESEKKFRSLISHMPGAVYRCACDSDWTMSFISKTIEEISGYPASDFVQNAKRSYASIIHPDDRQYVDDTVLKAVNKHEAFVLDYRILYRNHEVRWVFEKGQGIFDEKGNLQYLDGVIFDGTEHKRTELALKKSEKLSRALFTQLSSIVSGTAPATSGEDFFQSLVYHLAEALKVNYVFIDEMAERKNYFRTMALYVHGDIVENIEYDVMGTPCETVYKGQVAIFPDKVRENFPDDVHVQEWKIESYLGLPLMDDSGKVMGLLGIMDNKPIADVDNVKSILSIFASRAGAELQRRVAEERLRQKARELERVNKELQDFAHIASHDLQEPLRKIIIFGDRLEPTIQTSNEKGRDYLDRMQKSATRMRSFIEDLLHYTRVEMKALPFESVDLNEIAKDIINEFDIRLKENKGTVNIYHLPIIEADPFQMHQLFLNLIGNGLKFYREGVTPVINLDSIEKENGMWEITVEDNGIGIEEQHVDRIFKPFERLHNRSAYEGTGIGLTICNKIVTRHGGKISVKRGSENGVTFHITLPEKQKEIAVS